ncbi:hypothetical protein J3R80_13470 [Aliiroseovarius sp. Z3]|uniref:phosphoribosyltransferase-like protein n=1 Tax=Aliiroseovarius sp. Z3 TaxID=2811402 RepID=UPI0023B29D93|nr:hypothetical protein [Aliiroseovarius sp. Z3]MDE9451478.1 hypothetical protein [Aliiroseovarius sp. Z3]
MRETIDEIVDIAGDYREDDGFDFSAEHVQRWVEQFDEGSRASILNTVCSSLKETYFSKQSAKDFLANLPVQEKLVGGEPKEFWETANFLDIQGRGRSQREMLAILGEELKKQFGFSFAECGCEDGPYIYLDDGLFSGGHVIADLKKWLPDAPTKAEIHVITVALYSSGCYRAAQEIEREAKSLGKEIVLKFWRAVELENRLFKAASSNVYWPSSIPEKALGYFDGFTHDLKLRPIGSYPRNKIFPDKDARDVTEQAFLEHGVWIREQCPGLNKFQRPLGNSVLETPGFGATFVTFRNCPNNAPLVYWAGDPWYPLFPRKTNTDTALLNAFEELWE